MMNDNISGEETNLIINREINVSNDNNDINRSNDNNDDNINISISSSNLSLNYIRTPPPNYRICNGESDNLLPRYEDLTHNTFTILSRNYYYLIIYNKYLYNFINVFIFSRIVLEIIFILFNSIYFFYYEKIKKDNKGLIISLNLHSYFCLIILLKNYKMLPLYCKNKINNKTNYIKYFIICGDLVTTLLIFEYAIIYKNLIIKCIYILYIVINYMAVIILYITIQDFISNKNLKFIKYDLIPH